MNIPAVLGLDIPNLLPARVFGWHLDWMHAAGRLIWSTVILLVGVLIALLMARRPKSPEPATWAQAMLGATAVFGMMLLGYGVIPHEWLTFANSYLDWGKSTFVFQHNALVPFDVTAAVVTDVVEVAIYGIMVGINLLLWSMWQKREVAKPEEAVGAERAEKGTSAYGRPVTAS
jgi:hypothetical protein